jgi:FMN phosphatase YigB (HAD superfamily)
VVRAVLFDFYRTLVLCPQWEDLEIRSIGGRALALLIDRGQFLAGRPLAASERAALLADANRLYHAIRAEGRDTHLEWSAEAAVQRILATMGFPGDVPWRDVVQAVEDLNRACLRELTVLPGVPDVLAELAAMGLKLGVEFNVTGDAAAGTGPGLVAAGSEAVGCCPDATLADLRHLPRLLRAVAW